MVLDKKKIASRAYAPYHKEALYCFGIYIFVCLLSLIAFAVISNIGNINAFPIFIWSSIVYALADCVTNYRLSFFAIYENKKCNWSVQDLVIVKISEEHSWSGHWFKSVIPKLYPRDQRVDRYKLICENDNGKKIVLRAVLSGKKYQIIQDQIFKMLSTKCTIYYGRYSKIIMYYKSKEQWTDQLNHMF